jgi:hypothetical protein
LDATHGTEAIADGLPAASGTSPKTNPGSEVITAANVATTHQKRTGAYRATIIDPIHPYTKPLNTSFLRKNRTASDDPPFHHKDDAETARNAR